MDSPTPKGSSAFSRLEKRRKQRESLSNALVDPLERFAASTEPDYRSFSNELADERERLNERIRTASASSQLRLDSFSPSRAKEYVGNREPLLEDLAMHHKACRNELRNLKETKSVDRSTMKRILSDVDGIDQIVLRERAALARDRVKLENGIMAHPTHGRIGEAYLAALVDRLPEPAGARFKKLEGRSDTDNEQFRKLVRNAYIPTVGSPAHDAPESDLPGPLMWCPVTKDWHQPNHTTVAHIVPYGIGEFNASYIFGLSMDEGWNVIWGFENGLVLFSMIERHLDDGRIVLVPDDESIDEFKLIVLEDSLLSMQLYSNGPRYRDLHNKRLRFKTEARPLKRNLYFLCLITIFRRRRFMVDCWESDSQKIQMGKIWGTPGQWMRKGVIQALALEIGDIMPLAPLVQNDTGVSSLAEKLSAAKEREIAVTIREVVEKMVVDEDYE